MILEFSNFRVLSVKAVAISIAFAVALNAVSAKAAFVTSGMTGNTAYDGWVDLTATTLSTATLVAGFGSNEAGSGDAVLSRTSGGHYPASTSLYSFSTPSTLGIAEPSALTDVKNVVFSILTWPVGDGSTPAGALGVLPVLNYNGGAQALAADYSGTEFVGASSGGGFDTELYAYTFQWDLTLAGNVTAFHIDWGQLTHSGVVALQLEQSDLFTVSAATAPVPEPTAIGLIGLAGCGLLLVSRRTRFCGEAMLP